MFYGSFWAKGSALNHFEGRPAWVQPVLLVLAVALVGVFFAKVEIQIEGPAGWAATLPTWRVENSWALDIFWGGRPMTGYHAWVFSFMALMFHVPIVITGHWNWKIEARIVGSVMLFWIIEDLFWFLLNPDWGWGALVPERAWWHKHWLLGLPLDYLTFTFVAAILLWYSFHVRKEVADAT